MVDIQPAAAEIRRGKKRKIDRRKETTGQKILCPPLHRAAITNESRVHYSLVTGRAARQKQATESKASNAQPFNTASLDKNTR